MGELKDVLIPLVSNSKVHQTIDIIVVNISEAYVVILSRDWYAKLNDYFATYWYHLWLPYKGQSSKIKVEQERYMKHTVTDLNDAKESVMFSTSILSNFCFETFICELNIELSPNTNWFTQYELLHLIKIVEPHYTLVDISSTNYSVEPTNPNLWSLYFDSSGSKDGAVVGYLLMDLHGNQMQLYCHLEYKCSYNMAEYETLVQGLRKSINMNIICIELFGDSQVVIKQVSNSIACNSYHLKNY